MKSKKTIPYPVSQKPVPTRFSLGSFNLLTATVVVLLGASLLVPSTEAAERTNTNTHKEHNFDNGKIWPFTEDQGFSQNQLAGEGITFVNDNKRGGKVLKLTWKESEYDGSRRERGHEWRGELTDNNEVFCGYYMNVPNSFPDNKNTIVWQLYCWNSAGCNNWTSHMSIKNNDLYLTHRGACTGGTEQRILKNIPRGQDLGIQIRAILGNNGNGSMRVINNGTTLINDTDAWVGFGQFNGNTALTSIVGVKMGMYCFDTSDYTNNETRILYYDNFSNVINKGASSSWKLVDPRN